MFIGEYRHSVDAKGRLAVPTKYRGQLSAGAVVTRGLDRCLTIYPAEQWQELAGKLAALPISKTNARSFSRFLLAGAMDVDLDGQGRIIIPEYLRHFAGITKQVVIAGLFNRLEVWDTAAWEQYRANAERGSETAAEALELDI